jgi:hypothetical protein
MPTYQQNPFLQHFRPTIFILYFFVVFVLINFSTSHAENIKGINEFGCPAFDPILDSIRGYPQPISSLPGRLTPEYCNPFGTLHYSNGKCFCQSGWNGLQCDFELKSIQSIGNEGKSSSVFSTYNHIISASYYTLPDDFIIFRWGYINDQTREYTILQKDYSIFKRSNLYPGLDKDSLLAKNEFFSLIHSRYSIESYFTIPSHTELYIANVETPSCLVLFSTRALSANGSPPINALWSPITTITLLPQTQFITWANSDPGFPCLGRTDLFKNCICESSPSSIYGGTFGQNCRLNAVQSTIPYQHFQQNHVIQPTGEIIPHQPQPFIITNPAFKFELIFQYFDQNRNSVLISSNTIRASLNGLGTPISSSPFPQWNSVTLAYTISLSFTPQFLQPVGHEAVSGSFQLDYSYSPVGPGTLVIPFVYRPPCAVVAADSGLNCVIQNTQSCVVSPPKCICKPILNGVLTIGDRCQNTIQTVPYLPGLDRTNSVGKFYPRQHVVFILITPINEESDYICNYTYITSEPRIQIPCKIDRAYYTPDYATIYISLFLPEFAPFTQDIYTEIITQTVYLSILDKQSLTIIYTTSLPLYSDCTRTFSFPLPPKQFLAACSYSTYLCKDPNFGSSCERELISIQPNYGTKFQYGSNVVASWSPLHIGAYYFSLLHIDSMIDYLSTGILPSAGSIAPSLGTIGSIDMNKIKQPDISYLMYRNGPLDQIIGLYSTTTCQDMIDYPGKIARPRCNIPGTWKCTLDGMINFSVHTPYCLCKDGFWGAQCQFTSYSSVADDITILNIDIASGHTLLPTAIALSSGQNNKQIPFITRTPFSVMVGTQLPDKISLLIPTSELEQSTPINLLLVIPQPQTKFWYINSSIAGLIKTPDKICGHGTQSLSSNECKCVSPYFGPECQFVLNFAQEPVSGYNPGDSVEIYVNPPLPIDYPLSTQIRIDFGPDGDTLSFDLSNSPSIKFKLPATITQEDDYVIRFVSDGFENNLSIPIQTKETICGKQFILNNGVSCFGQLCTTANINPTNPCSKQCSPGFFSSDDSQLETTCDQYLIPIIPGRPDWNDPTDRSFAVTQTISFQTNGVSTFTAKMQYTNSQNVLQMIDLPTICGASECRLNIPSSFSDISSTNHLVTIYFSTQDSVTPANSFIGTLNFDICKFVLASPTSKNKCTLGNTSTCSLYNDGAMNNSATCACRPNFYGPNCQFYFLMTPSPTTRPVTYAMSMNQRIRVDYAYHPPIFEHNPLNQEPYQLQIQTSSSILFDQAIYPSDSGDNIQSIYTNIVSQTDFIRFTPVLETFFQGTPILSSLPASQCTLKCSLTGTSSCEVDPSKTNYIVQCVCLPNYTGIACSEPKIPYLFTLPTIYTLPSLAHLNNNPAQVLTGQIYYPGQAITLLISSLPSSWLSFQINIFFNNQILQIHPPNTSTDISFTLPTDLSLLHDGGTSLQISAGIPFEAPPSPLETITTGSYCDWYKDHSNQDIHKPCFVDNTLHCDIFANSLDQVCQCKKLSVNLTNTISYFGPGCGWKITIQQNGPYYIGQRLNIILEGDSNYVNQADITQIQFFFENSPTHDINPIPIIQMVKPEGIPIGQTQVYFVIEIPSVSGNIGFPTSPKQFPPLYQIKVGYSIDQTVHITDPVEIVEPCYWTSLTRYEHVCNNYITSQNIPSTQSCIDPDTHQIKCNCNKGFNGKTCRLQLLLHTPPLQNDEYHGEQNVVIQVIDHPNQYSPRLYEDSSNNLILDLQTTNGSKYPIQDLSLPWIGVYPNLPIYKPKFRGVTIPASYFKDELTLFGSTPHALSDSKFTIDTTPHLNLPINTTKLKLTQICKFGFNPIVNSCTCPQPWTFGPKCDLSLTFKTPTTWREGLSFGSPGPSDGSIFCNSAIHFGFQTIYSLLPDVNVLPTPPPTVVKDNVLIPNFHIELLNASFDHTTYAPVQVLEAPNSEHYGWYRVKFSIPPESAGPYHLLIVSDDLADLQRFYINPLDIVREDNFHCHAAGTARATLYSCYCKLGWFGSKCTHEFLPEAWIIDFVSSSAEEVTISYSKLQSNNNIPFTSARLEFVQERDPNGFNPDYTPQYFQIKLDTELSTLTFSNTIIPDRFTTPYPRYRISFGISNVFYNVDYDFFTFRRLSNLPISPTLTFVQLSPQTSNTFKFIEPKPSNYHNTPPSLFIYPNSHQLYVDIPAPEAPASFFTQTTPYYIKAQVSYYPPTIDGNYSSQAKVLNTFNIVGGSFSQSYQVLLPTTTIADKVFITMTYSTAATLDTSSFVPDVTPSYTVHSVVSPLFSIVSTCYKIDTITPTPSLTCLNGGKCMSNGSCQCFSDFMGNTCETQIKPCQNCNTANTSSCSPTGQCVCKQDWEGLLCNTPVKCNSSKFCSKGQGFLETIQGDKCGTKCTCINENIIGDDCSTCLLQCGNGRSIEKCSKCGCNLGYTGQRCNCFAEIASVIINAAPIEAITLHQWVQLNPDLNTDERRPHFVDLLQSTVDTIIDELEDSLSAFLLLDPQSLSLNMAIIPSLRSTPDSPQFSTRILAQITYNCEEYNPGLSKDVLKSRWGNISGELFNFARKNFDLIDGSDPDIDIGELEPIPPGFEEELNTAMRSVSFGGFFVLMCVVLSGM